jgi:hypothetical protein
LGDCFLWVFFENDRMGLNILGAFFPRYKLCVKFDENGLGDFFTHKSGHPGSNDVVICSWLDWQYRLAFWLVLLNKKTSPTWNQMLSVLSKLGYISTKLVIVEN